MGWGQEIQVCFELQNVSFSGDRNVDQRDQTCIINVSLDEPHPNGNPYTQGWVEK